MIFSETRLKGAFLIEPERQEDERGFFARIFCRREFEQHGIQFDVVQSSISFNRRRGTLRGMHYQAAPHAEAKLVRCTMGAVFDVIIDLRRGSATLGQWLSVELTATNRKTLFVPEGFAHGFQTLDDDCEVLYQMSREYHPNSARGVRWDDPAFAVTWPEGARVLSQRDLNHPFIEAQESRE